MRIMLTKARLAFADIFEAKAIMESKPRFSATFLISKTDRQVKEIEKYIEQIANEKWGAKASAILKQLYASGRVAFYDGDTKDYDGFADTMAINASSKARPSIADRDKTVLVEEDGKPYAGCYVNAIIDIWAQDNKYGKRINATLAGVQFVEHGDAFSGSRPASLDEFEDLSAQDTDASDLI